MTSRSFCVVGVNSAISQMFIRNGFHHINNMQDADIVVFAGGADVNPRLYGQNKNHMRVFCDEHEDNRDVKAYNSLNEDQIKVGICRGGQFLNVMNHGKLLQHVSGHASPHVIFDVLSNDSWMGSSSHHQMMVPDYTHGEVLAYSEGIGSGFHSPSGEPIGNLDIEPEVVWYERDKALCWQGHPEWGNREDENRMFSLIGLLT